jgi:predicted nuclease of predicted toxin-antitoxin system
MKLLFDQGTPVPLRHHLSNHMVETAYEKGWSHLNNGDLLTRAEVEGFDIFITTDQNLRDQQNLVGRKISIVVLMTTSWPRIKLQSDTVIQAIERLPLGSYVEIPIP